MARIALRAYNREIERLIEGGQIEEAVAHCRHIFKYFPKHINTYRLLGKAYLETQRYGDAADILQRVLSSIPDDFISHLGMSIIREDEGNLDEAIWHMERAFEVQPANRAIQDELRRLYGRRDGLEPPKIRLTRGALARMYAKGDLYPQAIAELRAALADDPQRLDLQVVLADVYGRAGQRVEAASICNGILRKLPYCLVANQVMADILANSERSEEAHVYRQRAQALDAYLAHITPGASTPDKVPDIAVSIDRLDWQPGKSLEGSSQPDWAASLGVELESGTSQKEEIPDWLSAVQTDADQAELAAPGESSLPFTDLSDTEPSWADETGTTEAGDWSEDQALDAAQLSSDAEIPAWMKDAGWSPSTGAAEEEPSGFDFDEEDFSSTQPEGELEEANLPDWLKEIAPEDLDQVSSTTLDEVDWDQPSDEDATILESTPDWFQEAEDEDTEQEESPDWLAGLTGAAAAGAVAGFDTSDEASAADELPDWLQEPGTEEEAEPASETWSAEGSEVEAEAEAEPVDEIPNWLKEMEAATGEKAASEPEVESELEQAENIPDWLQEMASADEGEIESETSEELPDWMVESEAETGIETLEAAIGDETSSVEETPDWLEEVAAEEIESESETAKIESDEEAIPTEALQPWLIESDEEPVGEKMAEYPAEPADEMPDWLIEMQSEAGTGAIQDKLPDAVSESDAEIEPAIEAEAEALADEGMTVITPPEQIEDEMGEEMPEMLEQDEEIEPEEQASLPSSDLEESVQLDAMDAEAAFSWLESLAVKQGADEALLLSPDERTETPPEWVQSAIESETEEPEQDEGISEAVVEETPEMEPHFVDQELEYQADDIEPEEGFETEEGFLERRFRDRGRPRRRHIGNNQGRNP
jgi:hypothetical protein